VVDVVAALGDRRRDHQVGADKGRAASGRGGQARQRSGIEAVGAARRVRLLRAVDGAERADRRRLVTRHAGAEQAGDGDCRDDADDGDDNQQFDQGEALVAANTHDVLLEIRVAVVFWVPTPRACRGVVWPFIKQPTCQAGPAERQSS